MGHHQRYYGAIALGAAAVQAQWVAGWVPGGMQLNSVFLAGAKGSAFRHLGVMSLARNTNFKHTCCTLSGPTKVASIHAL
jgi:hypothetical protein